MPTEGCILSFELQDFFLSNLLQSTVARKGRNSIISGNFSGRALKVILILLKVLYWMKECINFNPVSAAIFIFKCHSFKDKPLDTRNIENLGFMKEAIRLS